MKFTFAPEARPLDGYTIKRAIHRGGFGEVYYALSDGGKEVALKLLNNNLEIELRGVTQCLNLKHANLVTIFDIRQDADGDHWVVMEYVSGRGLYETLRDHPNGMPLREVLDWMTGITAGLSFLHDRGIVHRDLKPANVFRDHSAIKVGDVGLSKYISESRRSAQTQSVGTVYYMAPEVARGRYGREVDVYAMGIMLYEMITGTVPFDGQTTAEILMKHLTADPDVSVLPEKIRPVISAALEKDPDKRTRTVEEVERQFRLAVAGANVAAPVPLVRSTVVPPVNAAAENEFVGSAEEAEWAIEIEEAPVATAEAQSAKAPLAVLAVMWNALPAPLQWVIGGAAALLVIESGMLRPVAVGGMIGGAAYLGYQLLTTFVGETAPKNRRTRTNGEPPPRARPASPRRREQVARNRHVRTPDHASRPVSRKRGAPFAPTTKPVVYTPETPRTISKRQRATDVSTSISLSLAAAALVTTAVYFTTDLLANSAQAVYFGTITMLAAWALIIPSKLWEGRSGDSFSRRLALGSLGLGVGLVAAVLPKYLLIDRTGLFAGRMGTHEHIIGRVSLADGSGYPTIACFMVFFAALFAVRRWWWQVDSFRKSRFRVSSAMFTLLVGVIVVNMLQDYAFPDSLGATWALAISAVVQLSAGWTPPEMRQLRPTAPQQPPSPSAASEQVARNESTTLHQA